MIPPVMAHQLEQGLKDYLHATFPFANEPFKSSFQKFESDGISLMHEPFLSVRLPFRSADAMPECFEAVKPPFLPYLHQQRAYDRLACENPKSTLVATGTGSGKTECFLYPILEYCWRHRDKRGIKALIIYPMNALAGDQAGRIAKLIYDNAKLRNNVSVGLYVGGLKPGEGSSCMSEDGVITDRETMRANPPDILLTNYKMLDYLLVRPDDANIWRENQPDTLAYVAVDELHTFDGAQGTDLACLLRRLKNRLRMSQDSLCCVGTSATMGGEDSLQAMRDFAHDVFGEEFDGESVIIEDRLTVEEFFNDDAVFEESIPDGDALRRLADAAARNDRRDYLTSAMVAFAPHLSGHDIDDVETRCMLGEFLKASSLLRNILQVTGGRYFQVSQVPASDGWKYRLDFANDGDVIRSIEAMVALVSHARAKAGNGKPRPFLNVQAQLWTRELARFLATLDAREVTFDLGINVSQPKSGMYYPLLSCRDCGQTAWAALLAERGMRFDAGNIQAFYSAFFGDGENIAAVFPDPDGTLECCGEQVRPYWVCPECHHLEPRMPEHGTVHPCSSCSAPAISVKLAPMADNVIKSKGYRQYSCPCCGSRTGISLVGQRSTTTSEVMLTQIFSSDFDDDNHALAFSDNLQDASHRASFFTGRTWRFALRTAMRRYLRAEGSGLTLEDFAPGFVGYWKSMLGIDTYVARFIAPNTVWRRAYEELLREGHLGTGEDARRLIEDVDERLGYEVLFEFGMRSNIGRTLERSGAACLQIDPQLLIEASGIARELIMNEVGEDVAPECVERMVAGFIDRMRLNGAIADPCYEYFAKCEAKEFGFARKYPNYPNQHQTMPVFLVMGNRHRNGFACVDDEDYIRIIEHGLTSDTVLLDSSQIVACIARACTSAGLLLKLDEGGPCECLGINPGALTVTTECVHLTCDCCSNHFVRASANANVWEGASCPTGRCAGHLHLSSDQELDYYGRLFDHGDGTRIRAKEHTGLLARPDREEVERMFRASGAEAREWYPNVLSCTPTLEMGIDIGDLSSLVLCSMPPGQAQFLQRVGRAGRRDGNSLAVVIADANPHGAYFYGDPLEMIEGEVEAPQVFLHAAAVLERQFMAFCMDRWVRDGGIEVGVPKKMSTVLSNLHENKRELGRFPFSYLVFAKAHSEELFEEFVDLFGGYLKTDEEAVRELRRFVLDGTTGDSLASSMHVRFLTAFEMRRAEQENIRSQIKELNNQIRDLEQKPSDSSFEAQVKECKKEKNALVDVINSIQQEDVFGFLSREGLLPNYAFPEDGVHLRVVMLRRDDEADGVRTGDGAKQKRRPHKNVLEFSRAASAAMGDFAPGNTFYANGRHFTVDQVDMATAEFETWRLCPNCNHAEQVFPDTPVSSCPKCGDPQWEDMGQKRQMLRLRGVVSNCDYKNSLSDDASDRRVSERYVRQLLVAIDQEDVAGAFHVHRDGFEFAYEYANKATMREINFGLDGQQVGQKTRIAGDERIRSGFKVCTKCGKIQTDKGAVHASSCPARDSNQESIEECLFLYRMFETEALRITIPEATVVGDQSQISQSFTAAIMLGLRKKFGNVDHLQVTLQEEPIAESGYRMRYLVIYDSVPGGTGYLKQLVADERSFLDVISLARQVVSDCPCEDGCYRCLYAYRQSREIGNISKNIVIPLLSDILDPVNKVETVKTVDVVDHNVWVTSELEKRFVDALASIKLADGGKVNVVKEVVNGKQGWILSANEMKWEIEPQVHLGPNDGVCIDCLPDFIFRPLGAAREAGLLPVAVFTDGYAFHESIVGDDTAKREAVRRSGRYRVWSFSYDDVTSFIDQGRSQDYHLKVLDSARLPFRAMYVQLRGSGSGINVDEFGRFKPLELFCNYLSLDNSEARFAAEAKAFAVGMINPSGSVPQDSQQRMRDAIEAVEGPGVTPEPCKPVPVFWEPGDSRYLSVYGQISMEGNEPLPCIFAELKDDANHPDAYKKAWNSFWHLWNLMQFEPGFVGVCSCGLANQEYSRFWKHSDSALLVASSVPVDSAWEALLDEAFTNEYLLNQTTVEFMVKLRDSGMAAGEIAVGEELEGIPVELCWLDRHVCYMQADDPKGAATLRGQGWTVIERDTDFAVAMELLNEGDE